MPEAPISIGYAALMGRCPRCGTGKLFRSLLTIADSCPHCNLPFKGREQGDGPAFFGILIVGALTAIFAAIVEIKFQPPFWVQAAVWIPFIIGGSLVSLRWLKGALIAVQYQYRNEDFTS
jgi:uncharacterized protein (DUF983 family)